MLCWKNTVTSLSSSSSSLSSSIESANNHTSFCIIFSTFYSFSIDDTNGHFGPSKKPYLLNIQWTKPEYLYNEKTWFKIPRRLYTMKIETITAVTYWTWASLLTQRINKDSTVHVHYVYDNSFNFHCVEGPSVDLIRRKLIHDETTYTFYTLTVYSFYSNPFIVRSSSCNSVFAFHAYGRNVDGDNSQC